MKAVRCSQCNVLVNPSSDLDAYGRLVIATPGNHEPVESEGFAMYAETAICVGSEMLGEVVHVGGRMESPADL